jgi:uncharacterized protein (DUF111 family)
MTVAALLDLGADQDILLKALDSLNVSGFKIEISRVKKAGLDICDFNVVLDKIHENHDHDMSYLHGHQDERKQNNRHTHTEDNHEHQHTYEHRGLAEILDIIKQAHITTRAKEIAINIFSVIAEAEAKVHGVELNEVHFHEVGAIDSIVDIVAVAVCLDDLDIIEVIVPVLYEGCGFVRCQHGIIPIPVPAVTHIAQVHNLPIHITSTEGELVTPTGAAIVAAIRTSDKLPKRFLIKKTGVGAGKRVYDRPSMLRAMLISSEKEIN